MANDDCTKGKLSSQNRDILLDALMSEFEEEAFLQAYNEEVASIDELSICEELKECGEGARLDDVGFEEWRKVGRRKRDIIVIKRLLQRGFASGMILALFSEDEFDEALRELLKTV